MFHVSRIDDGLFDHPASYAGALCND